MTRNLDDSALALIAEGILDASEEEILRAAEQNGVDVDLLVRKVRTCETTVTPSARKRPAATSNPSSLSVTQSRCAQTRAGSAW